ncbi:hypothetical protein HYW53_00185 [Candidatus Giovannonibacteria bacterium]|nr:hypothetical protein [Candidatus Giovannonibacteria bacterium]
MEAGTKFIENHKTAAASVLLILAAAAVIYAAVLRKSADKPNDSMPTLSAGSSDENQNADSPLVATSSGVLEKKTQPKSGGDVTLFSPNGGEVWQRGKQYNLSWSSKLPANANFYAILIPTAKIIPNAISFAQSSMAGGQEIFPSSIFIKGIQNRGSYSYRVSESLKAGKYQVLILGGVSCRLEKPQMGCAFDSSDGLFTIK